MSIDWNLVFLVCVAIWAVVMIVCVWQIVTITNGLPYTPLTEEEHQRRDETTAIIMMGAIVACM